MEGFGILTPNGPDRRVINLEHLKFYDPTDQLYKLSRLLLLSHVPTDKDPTRLFSRVGIWDQANYEQLPVFHASLGRYHMSSSMIARRSASWRHHSTHYLFKLI